MLPAALLDHTRTRFPDYPPEEIAVTLLEKGGSDRKFYRLEVGAGVRSLILVKYSDQREENRHYVALAEFLGDRGVNVPQIHHHDPAEGLIWMQDLGEIDLWAYRAAPWEMRRVYYQQTLAQIARLHSIDAAKTGDLQLQPAFDERLYRWEQDYFFEHCLQRHFHLQNSPGDIPALARICETLASLPRVLVHRDFQSQNVMIREGDAWLIDFQGMRPGLRQYDLASLLYDPYVVLSTSERAELLTYYQAIAGIDDPAFRETYHLCAMQRLMQALGAYGYLGYTRGKSEFLAHIPRALASLREVVSQIPNLAPLEKILASL